MQNTNIWGAYSAPPDHLAVFKAVYGTAQVGVSDTYRCVCACVA